MSCNFLLAHPKLPILFVFTNDGRVICVAVHISILPPLPTPEDEEEDELSDDDEQDFINKLREPIIEVRGIIFREARVHPHELDFGEFDNQGNFLAIGGSDFGKIFLCDTQTIGSGLLVKPGPLRKKGSFKPSFGAPNAEQQETNAKSDAPVQDDADKDKYFQICHYARYKIQNMKIQA